MKNNISQSLYIIFGTSQGIGKAIFEHALKFDEKSDFVTLNIKKEKAVNPGIEQIEINLSKIITPEKLSKLFGFFAKKVYKNIYLINNASTINPIMPIGFPLPREVAESFNVNLVNYAVIINEFIKRTGKLKKTNKKILNISSGAAVSANYGLACYCSTKAALEMLSRCIFKEQLVLNQVKILAFRPGVVDTGMQAKMRSAKSSNFTNVEEYKKLFMQGKLLDPKEVAQKIFKVLKDDKYWAEPILDISDV